MIQILHVLDGRADYQAERFLEHLTHDLGDGFASTVVRIGRGLDFRNTLDAAIGLRRLITPDLIVHAWGIGPLSACAMSSRATICFSPPSLLDRKSIRWLSAIAGYRTVEIVSPTATIANLCLRAGLSVQRVHVIRPGVDFARIGRKRDPSIRLKFGFSPEDYVLLAAGESTRMAAHADAIWAAGIMHVFDPRYKLLLWGRGELADSCRRFGDSLKDPGMFTIAGADAPYESLLGAADAVLAPARGAVATLPIAQCMAAGLPILANITYTMAELLEDRHTAIFSPRRSPRLLAERMLEVACDSSLQWSITDRARTEAYEFFSLTRFLNQWREVYRQRAACGPIHIPEPPAGAAVKFHAVG